MKWRKETKVFMWANYFSEDGIWKAYDTEELVYSKKKTYNPNTHRMESRKTYKHEWHLENLETGEKFSGFETLKAAREYAEGRTA